MMRENFYARGDGTMVYFFTVGAFSLRRSRAQSGDCGVIPPPPGSLNPAEELREMMARHGLAELENSFDRRLLVNRGRRVTMQRVWVQGKFRKPLPGDAAAAAVSAAEAAAAAAAAPGEATAE